MRDCWLRICSAASNGIRVVRYWTPGEVHPGIDNDDVRGWSDALRRHLEAAVNKRLSRNTNAGVMFSGGMDSSSILVFAAKFLPRDRLATYSVLDRKIPVARKRVRLIVCCCIQGRRQLA